MNQEPLIWTSRGNLPVASLKVVNSWEDSEDFVKFTETYYAEDGEIVRQSPHVLMKHPLPLGIEQAAF